LMYGFMKFYHISRFDEKPPHSGHRTIPSNTKKSPHVVP